MLCLVFLSTLLVRIIGSFPKHLVKANKSALEFYAKLNERQAAKQQKCALIQD